MIPFREEQLAGGAARPARRPREALAVGRWHRKTIEPVRVRDPHRLLRPLCVDHEYLEVLESELVRCKQDVLARRMHVGRPAHRAEISDLLLLAPIELHRPDVGDEPLRIEPAPDDVRAVGGEEWPAVVAWRLREAF